MKKNKTNIRQELHQIPELDFELPLTLHYIQEFLKDFPCSIERPVPSSLCAYFDFQCLDTIAYRTDMDALPMQEENTHSFISKHPGNMHACGHDAHMAMVLSFASFVANLKTCKYNVLLIFQPAEETTGGAKRICESGILEKRNVIALFGIHVWPKVACGKLLSKPGYLMAQSSELHLQILGKGTHIATYQQGIDSLVAANALVTNLYQRYPSSSDYLLKFGYFKSGTANNCISAETLIKGSLRTFDEQLRDSLIKGIKIICKQIEKQYHCHILMHMTTGYPALYNNDALYKQVTSTIPNIALAKQSFLCDDFSFYAKQVPSLYFYLGTGKEMDLHTSNFDLDEHTLPYGIQLYKKLLTLSYKKDLLDDNLINPSI